MLGSEGRIRFTRRRVDGLGLARCSDSVAGCRAHTPHSDPSIRTGARTRLHPTTRKLAQAHLETRTFLRTAGGMFMVTSPLRVAARAVEALVGARRKPPFGAWKAEARARVPTCGAIVQWFGVRLLEGGSLSLFLFRCLEEGGSVQTRSRPSSHREEAELLHSSRLENQTEGLPVVWVKGWIQAVSVKKAHRECPIASNTEGGR